jgi:hypothetical protein
MRLAAVVLGSVLVLAGTVAIGNADTDCRRINKMLDMGRTPEQILDTGAGTITEEDIEKCKAEKAEGGAAAGGEQKDAQ